MKKYVIIGQLYGIGGWQTYINNKLKGVIENGWEGYALGMFCSDIKNQKYLPELSPFRQNSFLELSFCPGSLTKGQRNRFLKKAGKAINVENGDEIVFEATTETLLLWTELLAEHFNGKSICVNVKNRFPQYSENIQRFFEFKKERGEFLMMINNGFHDLLKGYKDYPVSDDHVVAPLTYNMYYDDGNDYAKILKKDKYDYIIGTIGWLDKPYYNVMCDEVVAFAGRNPGKKILFIVIGTSSSGNIEKKYMHIVSEVHDVTLELLGSMTPLPSNLIKIFDVCVASYGCAIIADKLGVKTIMLRDDDNIPLGIMGYTLRKWPYVLNRTNTDKTVSDILDEVLIEKICDNIEYSPSNYGVDKSIEIEKHINYLNNSDSCKTYYDILKIRWKLTDKSNRIIICLTKIIGLGSVAMLIKLKRLFYRK